jgi:calcineurin-like phosphoesterase
VRILYIAEAVSRGGVFAIKHCLPRLSKRYSIDFCIADADGVTSGSGLGQQHAGYLHKLGCNCLTLGECAFYKKDLVEHLPRLPWVLRPYNLAKNAPGQGWHLFSLRNSSADKPSRIGVVSLLGQGGFRSTHANKPLDAVLPLLERLKKETPLLVIDFHAEHSAEKLILMEEMRRLPEELRPTALIGSHTRVQTADELVDRGLASICDAGRSGVRDSVGGSKAESRIQEYLTGLIDWTREANGPCVLEGVLIEADDTSGAALSIQRIREDAGVLNEN